METHVGSSPHARGARFDLLGLVRLVRLIPACAGSTPTSTAPPKALPAHPRMRGEHVEFTAPADPGQGSSPHARGARWRCPRARRIPGLIPACAGSTFDFRTPFCSIEAHPRMRGEHQQGVDVVQQDGGSSPHARGARLHHLTGARHGRLIPACAGSTGTSSPRSWTARAHPRMRGEHSLITSASRGPAGSSPHARGAPLTTLDRIIDGGLIPACAGSTPHLHFGVFQGGAHPRMRGEHPARHRKPDHLHGSSPPARGAR